MIARIYVTPKKTVLDPQGKAVHAGLKSLGFDGTNDVRVGKFLVVDLDADDPRAARETVTAMCEKLLANTVIEEYRIEIDGEGESGS